MNVVRNCEILNANNKFENLKTPIKFEILNTTKNYYIVKIINAITFLEGGGVSSIGCQLSSLKKKGGDLKYFNCSKFDIALVS